MSEKELETVLHALNAEKGVTAKLSSIHVNYWVGDFTKVDACRHLIENHGETRVSGLDEILYCGDSPNDEPLFEFFESTVGVANVKAFLPRMKHLPRYLTRLPCGQGFEEISRHLLSSQQKKS